MITKLNLKELIRQCIQEEMQGISVNVADKPDVKKAEKEAAVKQQAVEREKQKALKGEEGNFREKRTTATGDEKKAVDVAIKDIRDKMTASKAALIAAQQKARVK